jgi:hypothetical protein
MDVLHERKAAPVDIKTSLFFKVSIIYTFVQLGGKTRSYKYIQSSIYFCINELLCQSLTTCFIYLFDTTLYN